VDFAVERLTATRVGEQEFYATLRRLDRRREPAVAADEARAALARLRAALPDEAPVAGEGDVVPAHQLADVERRLAETRERLARVRAARDRARRQRDRALAAAASAPADRPGVLSRLEQRLRRP
jgi:hypothetical protein